MSDAVGFLLLPLAAAAAFVLIHAYFGVHVLRRRIVFADLALAQLSALGATVAFANGYEPTSLAAFAYGLAFTAMGAALLTFTRGVSRHVSQEAFVGILYVVATAVTVLVIDRSPQGAEHVKRILIGNIAMVGPEDFAKLIPLYVAIGVLHWFLRRPMLALSSALDESPRQRGMVWVWDFVLFLTFGVVVTSSVTIAGVLLVFSFLIVPAVIGSLFADRLLAVLAIAWVSGIAASAVGLVGSYVLDLPSGATIVTALALALVIAGLVKVFWAADPAKRVMRWRLTMRVLMASLLVAMVASGAWLIVNPAADQPLLALFERFANRGPADFLEPGDRDTYLSSERDVVRFTNEVTRLDAREKTARHEAVPLSDDEIRRIGSYQQSFNEMVRGERFVQGVLREKARRRERWLVGIPAVALGVVGMVLLMRRKRPSSSAARGTGSERLRHAN